MARILILQDREALDMDTMGNVVRKRQIIFQIDGAGPFTYEVEKDAFSLEAFKDYVKQKAEEIKQMREMEV